jgi:4'-phosphopantetheinyl transferase EntD
VDFRGALRAGARRFEQIAPDSRGYFGWPAAARAVTAKRALALRARLMARQILRELGPPVNSKPLTLPSPRRGEGRRRR